MSRLKNLTIESSKSYMDDFLPTLSNFCSKSPLNISVKYVSDINKVFISYDEKTIEIDIDINKDKKTIIKELKNEIEKDYPIIYVKETKIPKPEEVDDMLKEGYTLSEALNKVSIDYVPKFKVIRKHDKFNELDVIELKTNNKYKYKCKIPVTSILSMIKYKEESVIDNLICLYKIGND